MNKLALITINYDQCELTNDLLKDCALQTDQDFLIIVVDLSVVDQRFENLPINCTVIKTKNGGYAWGVNCGVEKANELGCTHVAIMNNDIMLPKNFIEKIKKSLNTNEDTIIGGKIFYAKGHEFHKYYQKTEIGNVLWWAGGGVDWTVANGYHVGVDEVDHGQYRSRETSSITGCLMIFSIATFRKIGSWNTNYFMYYEDVDWCERAKLKNVRLFFDSSIYIWHKVSSSTGGSGSKFHQKFQSKNQIKFTLKYGPMRAKYHVIKNYIAKHLFT